MKKSRSKGLLFGKLSLCYGISASNCCLEVELDYRTRIKTFIKQIDKTTRKYRIKISITYVNTV